MKLFLDSANLVEIGEAFALGLADGVVTNPGLIRKEVNLGKKGKKKTNLDEHLTEIFVTAKGPVGIDVTKTDSLGIANEGKKLYERYHVLGNNVFIKIPVNTSLTGKTKITESVKAVRSLSQARIPVDCTLIFTPEQALLAAKAGAKYVSLGSLEEVKEDFLIDLVEKTSEIFRTQGIKTEIIASVNNARQVGEVALAGAHIAIVSFKVLLDCLNHEKTQEGVKLATDNVVPEYAKLGDKK